MVCWLSSLRSYKMTYVGSGNTHMCLSARKLVFSSVRRAMHTTPQHNHYRQCWALKSVSPQSSLNICSLIHWLTYQHPWNTRRNRATWSIPLGMYLELIHKTKTQRDCRCTPRQKEMSNLGTSLSEHPAGRISCHPQKDSGQQWPQWPLLQAVLPRPGGEN